MRSSTKPSEMKTVKFDKNRIAPITKHFQKVAKRCKKHGVEFQFSINPDEGYRKQVKSGVDANFAICVLGIDPYIYIPQASVTFSEEVVGTDWALVGISDFTETPIFHNTFDGFELPKDSEETKFKCSHCNSVRSRNKRFYVRKGSEVLELGSECVKSYLDINPNFFSIYAREVWDFDPDFEGFGTKWQLYDEYDVTSIIKVAAYSTLAYGYKKSGEDCATRDTVQYALDVINGNVKFNNSKDAAEEFAWIEKVSSKVDVDACIKYWLDTPDSEFNNKFKTAINHGYVTSKWIGILSYAYQGYLRSIETAKDKKKEGKETASSGHVGELKERLTIDVAKVLTLKYIESEWGGSHLVKFLDKEGNVFTTFTNGQCHWAFNEIFTGEKSVEDFNIKGTVKRHTEYNGVKENQVNRVAAKEVATA
jgi:hypothetical protein